MPPLPLIVPSRKLPQYTCTPGSVVYIYMVILDFFWIAAVGLVLITALYTIFGGMKSVLYTSVLQTPILLLGSLIILVLGLRELGGWDEMMRICSGIRKRNTGRSLR